MSFLLEDGTGLSASNSYASVAEFKAYLDDRGVSYVGVTDPAGIQQLLVKATTYIDQRFEFKGTRLESATQALKFPRDLLYDIEGNLIEGIPTKLKYATIEYANRARTVDLWLTPAYDTGGIVKTKRTVVGPIEESFEYLQTAGTAQAFAQGDRYLDDYVTGSSSSSVGSFR